MNGNSHGRLKVYMAVNGKKGSPLLTRYGTASSDVHWFREQLYVHAVAQSPSDMIEVNIHAREYNLWQVLPMFVTVGW